MHISFQQLRYILAVGHLGSFSKAATELHVSQPALSRAIAAVEDRFGIKIFDRTRIAVRPTAVGEALIEHAERLMLQARALEHNISLWSSGHGGSIAFGMGPTAASALMPPLLSLLATRYPSLRVDARVSAAQMLRAQLERDEVEFMVCDRALIAGQGDVEIRRLGVLPLGLFVRAGHPLAHRDALGPADIAPFPLARGSMPAGLEETIGIALLRRDATLVCDNYHVLKEVMLTSDALWLSSAMLVQRELAEGSVVPLDVTSFPTFSSEVDVIWLSGRTLSPAARLIAEHMETLLEPAAVTV